MKFHYHLAECPPTYDFVSWLVACDILREKFGAPDMEIVLGPGRRMMTLRDQAIEQFERDWRTYELLPRLARLLPTVRDVRFGHEFGSQNPAYIQKPVTFRDCLRAPAYAGNLVPFEQNSFVTLTVRQSKFQPERNTASAVWNAALAASPLPVVVVPDTEAEMRGEKCVIEGEQFVPAAFSPALRLALYEKAKLNLFTTGGPMMFACYSNIASEIFGLCVPSILACAEKHLTDLGFLDGATAQRTVFHWGCTQELVASRLAARLN